jgi:hypothetical protein
MRDVQRLCLQVLAAGLALSFATAASAQAPRSKIATASTPGVPEFRDPKTGQIWTPNNVGLGNQPLPPGQENLAFDPLTQVVRVKGVIVQRPQITPLATVPITAGPTVPIVNMDGATLRVVAGGRWQNTMYLDNNSANTVLPVIYCNFTNSGKVVEETRALLPPVGPGIRVGFTIYGPESTMFVDRASCEVTSP